MIKSVVWSQKEKDTCFELAAAGKTAREIGEHINRTKNSVIGLLHRSRVRLEGSTRKRPSPRPPKAVQPPRQKPEAKIELKKLQSKLLPREFFDTPPPQDFKMKRVKLFDAKSSQCKFIVESSEDPFKTICCGNKVERGSWCINHMRIVYVPSNQRWRV